jgi:large subunit ribosomal protein L20
MNRATNNLNPKTKHKKILKLSKGYKGSLSKLFIMANQSVLKALNYSYKGRKEKKENYKKLWTKRINITCKISNIKYNLLKENLNKKNIFLNKKIIAKIFRIDKEITDKILNATNIN